MKISELVKRTNVPKETIHYYIREGALPRPKKNKKNTAEYDEQTVEQLRFIKDLQSNYYLPLSEIKKIIKKQKKLSSADQTRLKFYVENFHPLDQISTEMIQGREAYLDATGMAEKWLNKMVEWGIITPEENDGLQVFSQDDVIIGKLIVAMDHLGVGPKDGYNPEDLKNYSDFVKKAVLPTHLKYLNEHLNRLDSPEFREKGLVLVESIGLFFYHIYRKVINAEVNHILSSVEKTDPPKKTKAP